MTYSLQRDDENYLEVLENYNEEAAQIFAEAFGELQYGMREPNREHLGVVYEGMTMNSDDLNYDQGLVRYSAYPSWHDRRKRPQTHANKGSEA